jgi:hypothetical protein
VDVVRTNCLTHSRRVLTNIYQKVTVASKAAAAAHPGVLLRVVTLHEAVTAASRAAAKAATVDKSKVAASNTRCFRRCLVRSMRCLPDTAAATTRRRHGVVSGRYTWQIC